MENNGRRRFFAPAALGFAAFWVALMVAPVGVLADPAEMVLHSFLGSPGDGADPRAGLIFGSDGNLYGTTTSGGSSNCPGFAGCGTVFKLAPDGTETVLHSFNLSDGAYPQVSLIFGSDGNLYGATYGGGNSGCSFGCGTVFKLSAPSVAARCSSSLLLRLRHGVQARAGRHRDCVALLYRRSQRWGWSLSQPDCRQPRQFIRHDARGWCAGIWYGVQARARRDIVQSALLLRGWQRRG